MSHAHTSTPMIPVGPVMYAFKDWRTESGSDKSSSSVCKKLRTSSCWLKIWQICHQSPQLLQHCHLNQRWKTLLHPNFQTIDTVWLCFWAKEATSAQTVVADPCCWDFKHERASQTEERGQQLVLGPVWWLLLFLCWGPPVTINFLISFVNIQ